jgi:hypothetical protein
MDPDSAQSYLPQYARQDTPPSIPWFHENPEQPPEPTLETLAMELASLNSKVNEYTSTNSSLQDRVRELERRVFRAEDVQGVHALLDRYTALHDDAVYDIEKRQQWEDLFAEDGVAVYPFGSHTGRAGKGEWAFGNVKYFELCQLLSANFDVTFATDRRSAHVRSNCIAQWVKKKSDLDDHFDEGGYYYWTLVKDSTAIDSNGRSEWKIQHVHLTITWTSGDDPSGVGPKDGKQGEDRNL